MPLPFLLPSYPLYERINLTRVLVASPYTQAVREFKHAVDPLTLSKQFLVNFCRYKVVITYKLSLTAAVLALKC